jgi:myo-inositol catabolism protein IolS
MSQRLLGTTGLQVSDVGFGCSRIGGFTAAGPRRAHSLRTVQGAVDAGITLFDTADAYANGDSETLLGDALRGRRHEVVLCSKGGYAFREQRVGASVVAPLLFAGEKLARRALGVRQYAAKDFSYATLERALAGSLRRLRTDYIDVYQLHGPLARAGHTDAVEHLRRFKQAGKIRHFGVGLETLDGVEQWLAIDDLGVIQIPFGLLDPEALASVIPAASRRSVGTLVRSVFGGSLLGSSRSEAELRTAGPQGRHALAFRALARELGRDLQSLALGYALAPSGVASAILGMHTAEHLSRTVQLDRTPLSPEVLARIARIHAGADA